MDCRDGCSSSNIVLQPLAKQANWSSRNSVRLRVVIYDVLRIPVLDARPSKHASENSGSDGIYARFWIISLADDLAPSWSGRKSEFMKMSIGTGFSEHFAGRCVATRDEG